MLSAVGILTGDLLKRIQLKLNPDSMIDCEPEFKSSASSPVNTVDRLNEFVAVKPVGRVVGWPDGIPGVWGWEKCEERSNWK